eukprot:1221580-Pyramimonas_sp.AAC.1
MGPLPAPIGRKGARSFARPLRVRRPHETLSVWHTVYTCIRERYWAKSDVWDSARQEVECFFGLMPLLRSEWDRPWLAQVLSVDASPRGRGVASSEFGVSTAKR